MATLKVRGFNKTTISKEFIDVIIPNGNKEAAEELISKDFKVRELIQEDWRDFVTSFFFPSMYKAITDPRIVNIIQNTNSELLEQGQESHVISLLVWKMETFLQQNPDLIEELLENLRDEQMIEAVTEISNSLLLLGK